MKRLVFITLLLFLPPASADWCASYEGVWELKHASEFPSCYAKGGESWTTKRLADADYDRRRPGFQSGITEMSCPCCYSPQKNLQFYRPSGESCFDGDRNITLREYKRKELDRVAGMVWCVGRLVWKVNKSVIWETESDCKSRNGKSFDNPSTAWAELEHQRWKVRQEKKRVKREAQAKRERQRAEEERKKAEEERKKAEEESLNYKLIGTGTGFMVNTYYAVTADHVVSDCAEVSVVHSHKQISASIVSRDSANDLGLILLSDPINGTAKLRGGKPIRKGERISNYGYPLYGELAESATITAGNVNNLSGLGNDSRFFQFDAPSQPGNSGGPVLDTSGNVVGVVSHILSKEYADVSGHIAQNVNFAVKSYLVEGFLHSNNVSFEKAESKEKLELPDIAEKAERFTVLVGCWD